MAAVPQHRVDEVLATVGLSPAAADKRVGTYSLGMRQRLGIAQTLIGHPEVLILDEPANGLDPEGIAWMRELLRDFADQGGTVLLSSHLLAEVEATVDRLVVIRADVVADGCLADLLSTTGLVARATDQTALIAAPHRRRCMPTGDGDGTVTIDTTGGVTAEQVASVAAQAGVLLVELRADRAGLEQLFFALTSSSAPTPTSRRSPDDHRHPDRCRHLTSGRAFRSPARASNGARASTPPPPAGSWRQWWRSR